MNCYSPAVVRVTQGATAVTTARCTLNLTAVSYCFTEAWPVRRLDRAWRWFDRFRKVFEWVVHSPPVLAARPFRGQARADLKDRRRTKRKQWLHGLG